MMRSLLGGTIAKTAYRRYLAKQRREYREYNRQQYRALAHYWRLRHRRPDDDQLNPTIAGTTPTTKQFVCVPRLAERQPLCDQRFGLLLAVGRTQCEQVVAKPRGFSRISHMRPQLLYNEHLQIIGLKVT